MNNSDRLKKELKAMIQKAYRCLKTAQVDLESGDSDSASSRAYYAVFHVIQAALLTKNLSFSKHSASISAFNQHFIKTSIFPAEFSKSVMRLFKQRQIGDYDYLFPIPGEEAEEDIKLAKQIVEAVEKYLKVDLK